MSLTVPQIRKLFVTAGSQLYGGEAVTQLEHALQAAWLAEQAAEDDALVTACLLHDLGHLLDAQSETDPAVDDLHQFRILPFLRPIFADAVIDAIGLHVDAKRYLCHADAGYYAGLSAASRTSLVLQGGPMDAPAAQQFLNKPHAARAVALRRYDDAAKQVGAVTPDFDYFVPRLVALAR